MDSQKNSGRIRPILNNTVTNYDIAIFKLETMRKKLPTLSREFIISGKDSERFEKELRKTDDMISDLQKAGTMSDKENRKKEFLARAKKNKANFELHQKLIKEIFESGNKKLVDIFKEHSDDTGIIGDYLLLGLIQYAEAYASQSPPSLPATGAKEIEDWLHKTMDGRHILNQITFPIADHFKTHPEKIPNELVITLFRILESFQAPQVSEAAENLDTYLLEMGIGGKERVLIVKRFEVSAPTIGIGEEDWKTIENEWCNQIEETNPFTFIQHWLRDKLLNQGATTTEPRTIGLKQALTAVDQWLNSDDVWVTNMNGKKIKGLVACEPGTMTKKFVENMNQGAKSEGKEMICGNRGVSQEDMFFLAKHIMGQHKGKEARELIPISKFVINKGLNVEEALNKYALNQGAVDWKQLIETLNTEAICTHSIGVLKYYAEGKESECDGDILNCVKDACICKHNTVTNHSLMNDENYKRAFAKYGKTHKIKQVIGTDVDLTKLPDGQSVIWGDGKTYHFVLEPFDTTVINRNL